MDGGAIDRSKGRGVDQHVWAGRKIGPDHLGGSAGDRDLTLFPAFSQDDDVPIAQIHIFEFETAIFARTDPGVKEQKQAGFETQTFRQICSCLAGSWQHISLGFLAAGQHGFDVSFCVGHDGQLVRPGRCILLGYFLVYQLLLECPGPEGRETGMVVSKGLFLEMLVLADEAGNMAYIDIIEQQIFTQVSLELAERVEVVLECMWGKLWFGKENIAFECLR